VVQLRFSLRYIQVLFIHPSGSIALLFALHPGAFHPYRWWVLCFIQVFFIHLSGGFYVSSMFFSSIQGPKDDVHVSRAKANTDVVNEVNYM